MHVVTFVSQKGGSGKSTLAVSLAVAAQLDGRRVALVDLDPQGSTAAWVDARMKLREWVSEDSWPADIPLRKVGAARIGAWIEEARARNAGNNLLVIIDTAGTADDDVAAALRGADAVVIPVQPSPQDMRALGPTLKQVRDHAAGKFAFVLSRASHLQVRENAEIVAVLEKHGPVACTVTDRVEFKRAIGLGYGPHESTTTSKAAAEIDGLWDHVKQKIEGEPRG
ncbi:ParA family protein [Methylobacterium sp. SI9]|uniref:ParA family protein n=1 Tax=Methylobacterium guangdongense TaxID=3138811 RepID=UPI00313E268B